MPDKAISIVDADPELAELLDEREYEGARREALARVSRLSPGTWDAAAALEKDSHHRGFLLIDGLLSREVDVLGRRCVELIGPSDVLRPWSWDGEGSHVQAEVGVDREHGIAELVELGNFCRVADEDAAL